MRQLADSGDFAQPAAADSAGSGGAGNSDDSGGWMRHIESLAGLAGGGSAAAAADSSLAAASPHMCRMLLRFRVSKKLLLCSVLLESADVARRSPAGQT